MFNAAANLLQLVHEHGALGGLSRAIETLEDNQDATLGRHESGVTQRVC